MDIDLTDAERTPPPLNQQVAPYVAPRLSEIFLAMGRDATGPVSVEEIRSALGDRSFAALLVVFALFNLLPLPPGSTLIFGIPLMLVSGQMMLGYQSAWLPRFLLRKSVSPATFRSASARLAPRLQWLERLVRPRHWPFSDRAADRFIGLAALILSVVVFLPIPLGNWLPAFSIAMIGVALSERDGLVLAGGLILGVLSFAIICVVVGTAGFVASSMFGFHF